MTRTSPYSTAAKHRANRATHYAQARQAWRHSKPHLELDDCAVELDDVPSPLPPSQERTDEIGIVERTGVFVVVPSPWISRRVNKRAARFWRSKGFVERTVDNSPHVTEAYVREWVRAVDMPLDGLTFTAKAWLEAAMRKHKELYNGA